MADAILEELLAEDIPMMPEWGQEGDEEPIEPEEADA